jgi:NADPH:quinone reductase-like Zn-dependent oxidoreductase
MKAIRTKQYGTDRVLDYAAAPFEKSVKAIDAVLDTVGGPVQQHSYALLKQGGSLVAINQPPSEEEARNHRVKASMLITETSTGSLQRWRRRSTPEGSSHWSVGFIL